MSTTITLASAPPSTNNLFATIGKKRVRTQRYSTWWSAAGWDIRTQNPQKVAGKVKLDISVKRPRSNADVSNYIKAAEDLLVSMNVIDDDKNVEEVTVRWADVAGCEIIVTPVRDVISVAA